MHTPDDAELAWSQLRRLANLYSVAQERADDAAAQRDTAIRQAVRAGLSYRQAAEAADVSPGKVQSVMGSR